MIDLNDNKIDSEQIAVLLAIITINISESIIKTYYNYSNHKNNYHLIPMS